MTLGCCTLCRSDASAQQSDVLPASIHIRQAARREYWPAADVHCDAFFPEARESWPGVFLRLDRVFAWEFNEQLEARGTGR